MWCWVLSVHGSRILLAIAIACNFCKYGVSVSLQALIRFKNFLYYEEKDYVEREEKVSAMVVIMLGIIGDHFMSSASTAWVFVAIKVLFSKLRVLHWAWPLQY